MNEELKPNNIKEEKRLLERKKIKLQKTFKTEMKIDDSVKTCFVYIVDISEAGMRIHTDFALPEGKKLEMKFYLDEPLDIKAKLIWQKTLLASMYVAGIEFAEISEEGKENIRHFIEKYSPEGKRKVFRLNRVLAVEAKTGEKIEKFYTLTTDLSAKGMRISHENTFPEGEDINFRILLDFDKPPIELTGKVAWQRPISYGGYNIGIEFVKISEEHIKRIDDFIDSAFTGKLDEQIVIPQEGEKFFESEEALEEESNL